MLTLPPFKSFLASNIPSVYDNTLSYYDELTKLIAYLEQQVIPAVNADTAEIEEIKKLLVQLKAYVDDYFKNLDVQEEINNKLDEMAEDGTLAEIINQEVLDNVKTVTDAILAANEPFTYHYIYSASNGFGNALFVEGDKNILVDFGNNSGVVDAYLRSKNVTKIDAIVITHYHADHTGGANGQGLSEVLSDTNIDFTGCVAYLPHKGIDWTQVTTSDKSTIMATETAVKSMLTTAGVTYVEPDNEQVVQLSTITKMQFFNIGSAFYDQYYAYDVNGVAGVTEYNSFSMLVKITHNDISEFETGDATYLTQKYNAQYLTDIDIYHSFHHGVYTPLHKNWELRLNADYCVVTPNDASLPADNADIICCGMRGARIHNVKDYGNTLNIIQTGNVLKCDANFNAKKNNLGVATRPLVMLEEGTDLDDITDDGCYYSPYGGYSLTMDNVPPCDGNAATEGHSFRLDVIKLANSSDDDNDIKQILTFGNTPEFRSGVWMRESRRYDTGFGKWYYCGTPSYHEGTTNLYSTYVFGTISGNGKELNMVMPLTRYIPEGYTISNVTILGLNIKSANGNVAYADSESQTTYTASIARNASGLNIQILKADSSAFSESDVCICGTCNIRFTLTPVNA